MMHEEVAKYRELSGDTNPNTPISRIGGYLDGYEKALEQTRWIPVSERLPKEWKSVLVCYKSQGGIAQCISERLINMDGSNRWSALGGQEPIAWMPLPAPFEPQESEG